MPRDLANERYKLCNCGSGLQEYPLYDGHNCFLTYACAKCETEKLSHFRPDIMSHYECDEAIEEQE